MALDWTNKINNVDNVDANDVNTLAAAIKDVEQSVTTEDGKLTDHKTKAVLDHPDSSVTTNKIANGAVSTDKIAPSAVTGSRIANNAVTDTKIADGAVTTSKIGKNAVGTDNIKDASVTTEKIADAAVITEKIKDGAVTSDKLVKKISVEEVNVSERITAYSNTATPSKATQDKLNATSKEVSLEHKEYNGNGDLTSKVIHKLTEKVNKSDLTAENIISVYSSAIEPRRQIETGIISTIRVPNSGDVSKILDIGGTYVPVFSIDKAWKDYTKNKVTTDYYVAYDWGNSSNDGLSVENALKFPSDAMKKAKDGDTIWVVGGYYPRNQLGFDQNKTVHIYGFSGGAGLPSFCNADNNRSLTWTLVEGSTYKTTRSQAYAVWQANAGDDEFSELLLTHTLEICKSHNGSYFIDGDTVYVNTPDGYSGAPGYDILVSLNAVGATINTMVYCEGIKFVFGGQAACLNKSYADPVLLKNCTFKYAKQNGFMSLGGRSCLDNCEAYENGRDGFSYKKSTDNQPAIGVEWNCSGHHNGDNESTGSDNGSTAHDGSIVTRINGKYYENKGPNIADVNPGTMSYNLNCACSNSTATVQDRQIDYNIEDGIMYLDRCTSDGSFISLYEASVTLPQTTKSYNLGSVLPGVYRVKNVNGVAENLSGGEDIANKVRSISSSSTDVQYPTAKAVNTAVKKQKTEILQQVSNTLKGTATGMGAVRIDDCSPLTHEMKVTVSSKNLIPYPYTTGRLSKNGISITANSDGTIVINGTATEAVYYTLNPDISSVLKDSEYTLSKNITDSNLGLVMSIYNNNTWVSELALYGSLARTFKKSDIKVKWTKIPLLLFIKSGTVLDNVVIKPQLERGTVATEYTPYVDPTSVTLTQRGKNLIPYNRKGYSDNGITYTVNDDGSVTANGTAKNTVSQYFHASGNVYNVPNGIVYTFSDPTSDGETTYQSRGQIVNTDGVGGFSFTCTAAKPYYTWSYEQAATVHTGVYLKSQVVGGQSVSNVRFYPQFELGDSATEFETPLPGITYSVPADGVVSGVKNIYPTTTLLSNIDNVVIDVEYNRDINKAFEELQNAILSQGGNV